MLSTALRLLHRDGKLYQQQELTNIDVAPEERSSFPLPFMVPALPGEYAVTISFRLKEDTSWAKKGHEVAFGQGVIAVVRSIPSKKVTPFTVMHGTHNIGVRGENFDVLFSDLNGGLTSYRYAGKEMIQEIPRPNFWRAPTDNDCGNNMGGVRGQWSWQACTLPPRASARRSRLFMAAPSSRTPPARWKPTAWS